jgi:hypothetical protein
VQNWNPGKKSEFHDRKPFATQVRESILRPVSPGQDAPVAPAEPVAAAA